MNTCYDIAVAGSGFAGSLIAMIARRTGRSVVLLERGKHPRVVIGESSTPLSNLLLEDLATRYDLPGILPLTKWGSWQKSYPEVACGLKRGFTFFHHVLGESKSSHVDRRSQLLVAASPHDRIADTHWYRADFDEMLVRQAISVGVDYVDEVKLERMRDQGEAVILEGRRDGREVAFRASFVIDATGPRGFLHHALGLREDCFSAYPSTRALYSHFSGVKHLDQMGAYGSTDAAPYPIDDAAVHHVFDGGWIWALQFNHGITSAGVAATDQAAKRLNLAEGAPAWSRLLEQMPVLKDQFAAAEATMPFIYAPQLSFMSGTVCGSKWALLPSAAGFVDPLLSTGFPLTLLGVSRLADIIEHDWGSGRFQSRMNEYEAVTKSELHATARLIASLYANMNNFSVFVSLSLLYFAAASFSETALRLKKPHLACSFLLHDHPVFGPACLKLFERAQLRLSAREAAELTEEIRRTIAPFDIAGLTRGDMGNWYPVNADDLLDSAWKVESTRDEIAQLLQRCGFYQ